MKRLTFGPASVALLGLGFASSAFAGGPEPQGEVPSCSVFILTSQDPPVMVESDPRRPYFPAPPGGFVALLRHPAARAVTTNRLAAAEAVRHAAGDSDLLLFLAYYLSRSEASWNISDRMLQTWNAYLKDCPLDNLAQLSVDEHLAWGRAMLEKGGGHTLSRLIALAHFLEASRQNASTETLMMKSGFRRSPDEKFWGDPELILQYRVSRYVAGADRNDPMLELAAVSSPVFGTRYAGVLLKVQRALAQGRGSDAFRSIQECGAAGGPKGAAEHLRALALSIKAAAYCRDCKDGRIPCSQCGGKGTADISCAVCNGAGRVRPRSAIGDIDLTTKCRNCDGRRVFKGVTCPSCAGRLSVVCPRCKGNPWKEGMCPATDCNGGRVLCPACQGTGKELVDCPLCDAGRVRSSSAVGNAIVTHKCRNCEINGQHGTGNFIKDCMTCRGVGRVNGQACGGRFGKNMDDKAVPVAGVYSTEPCGACGGAGWIHPRMALPCLRCVGLGVLVKPTADPAKVFE